MDRDGYRIEQPRFTRPPEDLLYRARLERLHADGVRELDGVIAVKSLACYIDPELIAVLPTGAPY